VTAVQEGPGQQQQRQVRALVDLGGSLFWLSAGAACSVAAVAALRWGVDRPVRSPWLLTGLLPPVAFEAWLLWPLLVG
jgi:hypothetical protein